MDPMYKEYLTVCLTFEDKMLNLDESIFNDIKVINYCLENNLLTNSDIILNMYIECFDHIVNNDENHIDFFVKCINKTNFVMLERLKMDTLLLLALKEEQNNTYLPKDRRENYINCFLKFDFNMEGLIDKNDSKKYYESAIRFSLQLKNKDITNKILNKVKES